MSEYERNSLKWSDYSGSLYSVENIANDEGYLIDTIELKKINKLVEYGSVLTERPTYIYIYIYI